MFPHLQFRSILLAFGALAATSAAQSSDAVTKPSSLLPTYHSTVSEVRVTFFATDERNHALATVSPSDFAVVDNERVVRNFRSFTRSDETPLDIIALVDMSESMAPRFSAAINDVLQLIAREQSIPGDNISVLSFGGSPHTASPNSPVPTSPQLHPAILCASACRAPDSVAQFQSLTTSGNTPLYDALIFGSDFISHNRRPAARTVVILFSDGNDTISLHSANDALQSVADSGALVYSVDMAGSRKSSSQRNSNSNTNSGSAFLQELAETTGGLYFSPRVSSTQGAAALLNSILEDLRDSYVVTYELPSHQAGFHTLRLLPTRNLNLTFHQRNGYIYDPNLR